MSALRSSQTDLARPTLRQRGADLKAGLARVLGRRPAPKPAPPAEPPPQADPTSDPIFAAIDRHLAARAACVGLSDAADKEGFEEAHDRRMEALEAVEATKPTTIPGLFALARHLDAMLHEDHGPDHYVEPTAEGHAFVALINACLGLADAHPRSPAAAPDPVLAAIAVSQAAEAAMQAFGADPRATSRPGWSDVERELDRAQRATRDAVWATVPTTPVGRVALAEYAWFQVALFDPPMCDPAVVVLLLNEILGALTVAIRAEAEGR